MNLKIANVSLSSEPGGAQLQILQDNISYNKKTIESSGGSVVVRELWWGSSDSTEYFAGNSKSFDIVLASDLLYIGIRDNIQDQLVRTLKEAVPLRLNSKLLLIYQERRSDLEAVMIEEIQKCDNIDCLELPVEACCYTDVYDSGREVAGGDTSSEGNICLSSLFGGVDDDAVMHLYLMKSKRDAI